MKLTVKAARRYQNRGDKASAKTASSLLGRERLEEDFDWFLYQSSSSSQWRWSAFINRRLNWLAEVLGQEAMRVVQDDAILDPQTLPQRSPMKTGGSSPRGSEEEQEAWHNKVFGEERGSARSGAAMSILVNNCIWILAGSRGQGKSR